MKVLGIETSCDETGLAIYESSKEEGRLLDEVLYSQIESHAPLGGVLPELAAREHMARLPHLLNTLLAKGHSLQSIDLVAYTATPGLLGALSVGVNFAKALALGLQIPALGVHHLESHLLSPLLSEKSPPPPPWAVLLVSGGHTQLIKVESMGVYRVLGEQLDDALGEVFDKVARLLGLPYPGGKALSELAKRGDDNAFDFPRPLSKKAGLDLSFSGLKTKVRYTVEALTKDGAPLSESTRSNLAAAFEKAAVESVQIKVRRLFKKEGALPLWVVGGVAANHRLRSALKETADSYGAKIHYPDIRFCTDNGAMVALLGALRGAGESVPLAPRTPLSVLSPFSPPSFLRFG